MKQLRHFLVAILFAASAVTAMAQAGNDLFANRYVISGTSISTNGDTAGASSRESGEPAPYQLTVAGQSQQTVWYEWTPVFAGTTTISISGSYRETIAVYTGTSVGVLSPINAASAVSGGMTASFNFSSIAGTSYKIQVGGRGGANGTFTLAVNHTVSGPAVILTAPTAGQNFTNPTTVTLTATVTPNAGTVTNVSFFYGGSTFIGQVTNSPYTMTWSNVADGAYTVTAQAADTTGQTGTSGGRTISVRPNGYFSFSLVGSNNVTGTNSYWRYKDDGSDQGTAWIAPGFNDNGWLAGPAAMGYGEAAARQNTTNISFGPDANNKYPTTYFRHAFTATNVSLITNLVARFQRDDGVALYLNGVEVVRDNLAAGALFNTLATANAGDDGTAFLTANLNPALLVNGLNVLASEIHQDLVTSSDITWYMDLTGSGADGNPAPTVAITSPTNTARLSAGSSITINATATDSNGSVTNVTFFANGTNNLGSTTNAPYSVTWNSVPEGTYALTAAATDNQGASTISAGVSITVSSYTVTPVTLIATGAVWKYLDNGSDQGSAWTGTGFNDAAWASGPAELGYGDLPDGRPEATVLCCSNAPIKFVTYYFRKAFNVADAAAVSNLTLRLMRDDGAVVYLNGVEQWRDNMAAGPVTFATLASVAVGGVSEFSFFTNIFGITNLVTGANVLAVEVHQVATNSSDVSFDLELIANTLNVVLPTNAAAPFVQSQNPVAGATVGSLTSVQVVFSESVTNVDAADLLVNGSGATGLSGGPASYTFTFAQPANGPVNITWAAGHGITDRDPAALAFNGTASSNIWSYNLADLVAPTVAAKNPTAGATMTNLTSVNVTFSEAVTGVGAGDLLVNGAPAGGLTVNSGSNYTFTFAQPSPGTVSINWITGHGITDLSASVNAFSTNTVGANWTYNLTVPSISIIASNASGWKYLKGLVASAPAVPAWRQIGFDDSAWSVGATPFNYSTPYTDTYTNLQTGPGTYLADMQGSYQSVYLRHEFVLASPAGVSNFIYKHQVDDGLVAWINGVEVLRVNMATSGADPANQPTGVGNASEPNAVGAAYIFATNTLALGALVVGTNILAVQACNNSLAGSSDFGFNLQFEGTIVELNPSNLPPRLIASAPASGDVFSLASVSVTFSEPVTSVNASDLLINGVAATGLSGSGSNYTFTFPQPAYGAVSVTWAVGHGIVDFDAPPKNFDGTAGGATFSYMLLNSNAPVIFTQAPVANATVSTLTSVNVIFSKPVSGVDAGDLRVSGAPASSLTGSGSNYTFTFTQPAYGNVGLSWTAGHGIFATGAPADTFDGTRPGNTWSYTLVDQTPPTISAKNPVAGANVTNLTSLSVTFSENVAGVNAADLLINGVAATSVSGSGANYTFTFVQPNTSVVNVNWAIGHGITDTATVPNAFDGAGAGATWQYFTPDSVAPVVTTITPPPSATVRDLTQVAVTFSEPVTGVNAGDLKINSVAASSVSGSAAGPYTFTFTQPVTGVVDIIWAAGHGITDLAAPANNFAGGEWSYLLNPNAVFADKIVINEIMFQPPSKLFRDEWIELRNTDTAPLNLNGWKFTKGVDYTFPNVTIPAGGYLVVAADTNAFHAKYPAVTNYIGPWIGDLANHDASIQIETALGETVNSLHYAAEGDWAVRIRGPLVSNHRGWVWRSPAGEASGPSLELMNPALPNKYGNNWRSSIATNGTPGVANSVARTNIPPLILDMAHFPSVPRSTDAVVITAKILDERTNGLAVTLFYRNASTITPPSFTALTMFDDGAHNDGVSGDKFFAATIPALPTETVVEFFVQAVDLDGNTNQWPAAAFNEFNVSTNAANANYQVDDSVYAFPQPLYKLIMTETERRERRTIETTDTQSNAEMNGSLITIDGTGTEVRYNIGIRERGAGSRGRIPGNQRVNVPTDRRWKGVREFNLNTQYTHAQYAGYLLSRKSGLDTENARIVRVTINNTNNASAGSPQFGCYIHVEAPDSDMGTAHWPLDDGGNVYRISSGAHAATLAAHQPPTSQTYSNLGYFKASNSTENDYSDLTNLTYVLNVVPDSIYEASVRSNINVDAWLTYFAVNSLLENTETSIGSGIGDDAGLYHAPRENKWYFIAHDWDTVIGQGDTAGNTSESIFIAATLPSISRFLNWTNFQPLYYAKLRQLATTVFAPAEMARTLDEGLAAFTPAATIDAMKQFNTNRVAYVLSVLPADPNALNVAATNIGGTISNNLVFASSNVNYFVTGALTIASGATLTIQPGVTVQVASGVNITVANGGRLLAEGTAAAPILFTRSSGANWGHIIINGAVGSPESRISHARLEFNATSTATPAIDVAGGTAVLDYLTFGNTASPYIHVDNASFVVSHCEFPSTTASYEPVHGNGAIKSGGRGIFYRNWFGKTSGYNDSIDFTGGNRPGSPVVQFLDNVFTGSDDDILDIDGTDAWVEGNIFLHAHRNGSPDSASAVSGGNDAGNTSEITVIGNIFFDVDQAATAKQLNFYTFMNNTVVHQSGAGFGDAGVTAVLNFGDEGIAAARGMYVEGNILYDLERITRNVTNGTTLASNITFNGNLMPLVWAGPGATNLTNAPLFTHVPTLAETTNFTNWASAQVLRDWLSLRAGSPGLGNGPNGADKGVIPVGATVAVGAGATTNDAVFTVGLHRTNAQTVASGGFPNGSGYTHYKWRLDGGAWSAETPVGTTLNVPGFKSGTHRLDVSGKRDTGTYQDDPDYGELALVTSVYNQSAQRVRLNEVLASNGSSVPHEGTYPDAIELHNPGASAVDISGLRLTDDATNPDKFIFDAGTTIAAGGYLVVYANDEDGTTGIHIGFTLNKDGQSLQLYDTVDHGGVLIDSVTFGLQLTDYSVGRVGTNWTLVTPSFGAPNVPAVTGPATRLVINEILTAELTAFPDDFVEIRNPQARPVAMAGLFFTDNPAHWPNRSPVPALTFIGANSYIAFRADGKLSAGADHLDFSLEAERGLVALLNTDYSVIDCVIYGPQTTDISQGRVVNNIYDNNFFTTPTPGAPNPGLISTNSGVVLNEILAANSSITELNGSTPDWIELYNLSVTNVDLSDYSLTDTAVTPRKYVFAPGTIIPGNGYLRLYCDGSLTNSATNTGFNIKAEGGSVYLFDKLASGGALLNAVTYGLQAVDFSISRVPNGSGVWTLTLPTPGGAPLVASTASATSIKINEWMAAPSSGEDWFELWNPNNQPVAIGGYFTTDDLNNRTKSPIPALSYLGASTNGYQRFWADGTPSAGANHANFKFSILGESIGFANPAGTLIDSITFAAQQTGVSEGRFPDGAATIVRFPGTESPGDANYLLITNVVINEALTHTDPPFEDAIELRNLTAAPINIGHWWLSDAKGSPRKYRITNGVIIPANGYVVFYEYQFNNDPTNNLNAFSLSSAKGDQIFLSTGDTNGNLTGYRTTVDFGAAQNGVPFGRYVTSDNREEFVAMSARSFGQDDPGSIAQFRTGTGLANPYPKVGPVVISQIMYHPPDVGTNDNTLDEFIELKNITASSVPLYDPLAATNTWRLRDAVDFNFPTGVVMAAGERLLVVSFDPVNSPGQLALFRSKYGIPGSMAVHGPYTGKLANNDDKVELYRPDNPDAGFVPYVLADRVHYYDLAPWTSAPDGSGLALLRVSATGFGNDPTNWIAATPNFGGVADSDGDGMPDAWELQYGLNPLNPADATQDLDGDGSTNLEEYLAGTNPTQAGSVLRITSIEYLGGNSVRLTFLAVSNRTYTLEYKDGLTAPAWLNLSNFSASATNRVLIIDTTVTTNRFFRLRTPQASVQAPSALLFISSIQSVGTNTVSLGFFAASNQSYTIEYKDALTAPSWLRLVDVASAATNRSLHIATASTGGRRFYRLRSPLAP